MIEYLSYVARFGNLPMLDNFGRKQSMLTFYFLDIFMILLFAELALFGSAVYYLRHFLLDFLGLQVKVKTSEDKKAKKDTEKDKTQ